MSLNRRQLGKSLVSGLAASALGSHAALGLPSQDAAWSRVLPGVWKATIGTPEAVTPVKTRLVPARTDSLGKMKAVALPPIKVPVGSVGKRGVKVELPLESGEEIFGLGLQFYSVTHRGKKYTMRVNADPRADTGDSHAPVPFYATNRGYGILIDTVRYAIFYCGNVHEKPKVSTAITNGGAVPTTTTDLYLKQQAEGQHAKMLVEIPVSAGVDVYLFAGPTMREAVQRYNLFSGGGANPPEWGLGCWYRTNSNATEKDVTALMQEFRDRKIPCDVIGLEPGWQTHAYSCSFVFNKERFPDPAGFVKKMQSQNLHVNLWEHAFVHPSAPFFSDLEKHSGDKGVWGGLVPDFQDQQARKIFGGFHGKTLLDIGVDGFKLDECDNSDFAGGWSFPELSQFPSGIDGEQMHSLFGLRYQKSLWDQFDQRKRQTYGLVRSSGALASPYPFVLYSDLYEHRLYVRALVNSSFSGLLWSPEVRDAKSTDDLIRRMQTVVFSPLAQVNGWYIPNPPWKQMDRRKNNAGEFMQDWEAVETRCREILGWRMRMVPYLRAAFERYAEDGTPPFRALALDWPDIPEVAKVDDAWMVGDRMLVAPLFAGEPGRTLTLPPGDWNDFWTGELVHGGTKVQFSASYKGIPVFVKTGSVMPLAAITDSTADAMSRELVVKVFGDGHLPFSLETSGGLSLRLSWDAGQGNVVQDGSPSYNIRRWENA